MPDTPAKRSLPASKAASKPSSKPVAKRTAPTRFVDVPCAKPGCPEPPTRTGACPTHAYVLRHIPVDRQPWLGLKKDWPKKCRAIECDLPRYGNDKHCFRHYNRVKATGTTADPKPKHYADTCAIAYCEAASVSYSVCSAHAQSLAAGRPAMVRDESTHYCLADCGEPTWSNGLCRLHYSRARTGTPRKAIRPACREIDCTETSVDRQRCAKHLAELTATDPSRVVCTHQGCEKNVIARGLCSAHYYAARRAGTLADHRAHSKNAKEPVASCAVPDCDGGLQARGLCGRHYDHAKRTAKRSEVPIAEAAAALLRPLVLAA